MFDSLESPLDRGSASVLECGNLGGDCLINSLIAASQAVSINLL